MSAHRYFADALDAPPAAKLSAPVTVVVAADDPSTAEFPQRHRDWQLLAEHVDLHELADGGHYFLRTRPTEAAQAVLRAADCSTSSLSWQLKGNRDVVLIPGVTARRATCNPASLRSCGPTPPATRRAGPPSTGTRCAPSSPSTARSWSAASGCATRPRSAPSSGGWPPV